MLDLPLDEIRPSPENDRLYRPIDPADPQIVKLAGSIGEHGVQEPLLITQDGWIISGHRRFAAARLAGLGTVPCRIAPIVKDADHDRFMTLLRECNRQRVKSFDEKLREEIVSVNPDRAYRSLIAHRSRRSAIAADRMAICGATRRAEITEAKMPFVDAINKVLDDLAAFCPLSARQIHYALLNDPPLRHAGKPDSAYRNDKASYKSLTELLTRARLVDLVPMDAIADETRPVTTWKVYRDPQDYMRDEMAGFLQGYWRDLLASQPNHIELVIEKNTIAPILMPVAEKYCMPTTVGRGYCSLPPRRDMASRFMRSGKEKFILLIVSDFDPDGEEIAHSLARSLRDDFGVRGIEPIKVALTAEQVEQFNLVSDTEAKLSSSNYRKFVARYGKGVFELEALRPAQLQAVVQAAIDSVLDTEVFNAELEQEKSDAASLAGVRAVVCKTLGTWKAEGAN
ncbi:MAG: hypothetical protein BIFFINMI_03300 [Phycisphaerae bacterium]|nr:hypothetical protein [Phycisphaerae bacterium]